MRRLLTGCLVGFAALGIGSAVFAENPNGDPGKPSVNISAEQAARAADILTIHGTATEAVRAARTAVFLEKLSARMGQVANNPEKAIDFALDDLVALPASDIVPSSGSGGGGPPYCVSQFQSGFMNCPCCQGGGGPVWNTCWIQAFQNIIQCMMNVGTCYATFEGGRGNCRYVQVPGFGNECRYRDYPVHLGVGDDGILNARLTVNWLPGAITPITVTVRRLCGSGGVASQTIDPVSYPSGSFFVLTVLGTQCGLPGKPQPVEFEVDEDINGNGTINTSWVLQMDCM